MSDRDPSSRVDFHSHDSTSVEPVWTYRGYQLRVGEFTNAMIHLFRGEVGRSNLWRQRLDATTNWAVVATGAAISFAFGSETVGSHAVIILNTLLVTLFLLIEARRYRYYELWSSRVRLMETDFFAAMLVPPFRPAADWAESLAENLLHPSFTISMWEALGRRLRRNYLYIYLLLGGVWFLKVWVHPTAALTWDEFLSRASIGATSGRIVLLIGVVYNAALLSIAVLTQGLKAATGEVLPKYGDFDLTSLLPGTSPVSQARAWFRRSNRRRQVLTFIITDAASTVGERIIHEMKRGVTRLNGVGMYSGKEHNVMICALTITEVPQLKTIVKESDPHGFVIVSPAEEILGGGFTPLQV